MSLDRVNTLVLQEFRLSSLDDGTVARLVGASSTGHEAGVPLLTSIDDPHDVATIRALRGGESSEPVTSERRALGPLVSTWQPERRYAPRIAERSQSSPTHYRLAVTESGINDEPTQPARGGPLGRAPAPAGVRAPADLLWIAHPVGTHAGLLILIGDHETIDTQSIEPRNWPLAMSRGLGVRIYDSGPMVHDGGS